MKISNKLYLLFSLVCVGCSFTPVYERPEVKLPSNFSEQHQQGESIANIKWFDIFKDQQLQALVKEALENNKDLKKAAARIEESSAVLGFTRSDQFPSLDIVGSANRSDLGFAFKPINSYGLFGSLSYEVDLWGKYSSATQAGRADLFATTYGYNTLTISLISQVADLYFRLIDIGQRVNIAEQTLKNRTHARQIIEQRLEKGIIPELDLNQAQIEEYDVKASLQGFKRELGLTEHALLILLGRTEGAIARSLVLSEKLLSQKIPTGIPANLLVRRPDLLALENQIKSNLSREGVAWADRFPSIDIGGTLGLASNSRLDFFDADAQSWSVGGSLFSPLLNMDRFSSRLQAQEARTKQAKLEYENAVIKAVQEVQDSLTEINTFHDEYKNRQGQVKASKNANILSRARYDDGVTGYLEVLDVERSRFNSELRSSIALRSYLSSIVKLYRALGGGW
jgi:multidrug efflux system outer membrane protein